MPSKSNLYVKCTVTAGLLLAMALPLSAQLGLALAPMRVDLRLAPGQQYSGSLALTNDSTAKGRIRAELLDFFIDASASPQFVRSVPAEGEYSCRSWLSLNPTEMELQAGAHTAVRYTLRVPSNATERSYHCAAGFTTLPPAEQVAGTGIRMAVRAVAAFYVVVGNPPVEGGVKEVKLERVEDPKQSYWQAVVVLENHGLMHFRPSGEMAVLDAEGKTIETAVFVPMPVLPKREQRFLFPLKLATLPEKFTLRARVDIGLHEIQEVTAVVAPPAQSVR